MPVPPYPRSGRAGRWRRLSKALTALGLVVLLAAALVGTASERPSAAPRTFSSGGGPTGGGTATIRANVTLTDAPAFDPSSLTGTAGDLMAVDLTNSGNFTHTFTVSSVANHPLNRSWSPTSLAAFFHANGSWTNISVAPGTSAWANFTIPANASGSSFEFVSLVAYQFQAGMFGFLNVTGGASGAGVQLTEQTSGAGLAFVPAALGANATTFPVTIDIAVSNLGSTGHTWSLVGLPNVNLTPGNFTTFFQAHPSPASVDVPTTPGQVVWANFTIPQAGVYQYLCEIPGHFAAGMFGYLYVGVPVPASVAPPSTAIVEPLLLAGAGALLGVGILLALVASLVGRIPPPAPKPHH
ncbi:MAG: plastocyanin/azurin family copper-binding protein [Thermoplasmata archaeon]|nr:plastocyanin/azurin family copper-binding protein [Thermoplasmata archaeon]